MACLVLIVMFVLLAYGWYVYSKTNNIFNPIMTFIAPLFLGFIVYMIIYNDATDLTLIIYLLGILAYFFGYILCKMLYKYSDKTNVRVGQLGLPINKCIIQVFKVVSVVVIICTAIYISRTAFAGPFGANVIRNLRYIGNYEGGANSFVTYGLVVERVLLYIVLYQYWVNGEKRNKVWILPLLIGAILGMLTTVARTTMLDFFVSIIYLYMFERMANGISLARYEKLKDKMKLLLIIVGILVLFTVIAEKTAKAGTISLFSNDFFLYRYLGSPLHNFDKLLLGNPGNSKGYYSLGLLGRIFSKLHMGPNTVYMDCLSDLYHGPVFSFIGEPYADFGIIGVVIVMFIQGYLHSYVFMRSNQRGRYWTIFYTSCIYSNLLAFYAFQYMMSSQVYLAFLILIVQQRSSYTIYEN